jgi:hypothetical protein
MHKAFLLLFVASPYLGRRQRCGFIAINKTFYYKNLIGKSFPETFKALIFTAFYCFCTAFFPSFVLFCSVFPSTTTYTLTFTKYHCLTAKGKVKTQTITLLFLGEFGSLRMTARKGRFLLYLVKVRVYPWCYIGKSFPGPFFCLVFQAFMINAKRFFNFILQLLCQVLLPGHMSSRANA